MFFLASYAHHHPSSIFYLPSKTTFLPILAMFSLWLVCNPLLPLVLSFNLPLPLDLKPFNLPIYSGTKTLKKLHGSWLEQLGVFIYYTEVKFNKFRFIHLSPF